MLVKKQYLSKHIVSESRNQGIKELCYSFIISPNRLALDYITL